MELRYGGNRVLTLCPEVKYQAGLSSLWVSCKRALKKRFQHRYFLCEYCEVFKSSFFCIEHHRRLLLMKQCRIQSHFEAGIPVWIPISNPQMLKTVDFWCKLWSTFLVAEPRERCFELFRMQNSQKFPGFRPWTPLRRAYSAVPGSPATQRFFSSLHSSKSRHPQNIAGYGTVKSLDDLQTKPLCQIPILRKITN